MADRLLIVVYLLGICIGGAVAFYGFVIFVGIRPGGTLMGMAGLLLGLGTIATGWLCFPTRRRA